MTLSKREQIIEAAHQMFLEHGYGASSMDGIAAAAQVSKRTVYSHFANKDELFRQIIHAFCGRMSNVDLQDNEDAPIEIRLKQVGIQLIHIILHPEAMATLRIVMAEKDQFPSLAKAFWEAGPLENLNQIAATLAAAPELEFDDPALAARQLAGTFKGPYFIASMLGVEPRPSEAEIEHHVDVAVERFVSAARRN